MSINHNLAGSELIPATGPFRPGSPLGDLICQARFFILQAEAKGRLDLASRHRAVLVELEKLHKSKNFTTVRGDI